MGCLAMKKRSFLILLAIGIICLGGYGWFAINKNKPAAPPPGANAYSFVEELFGNTLDLTEQRARLHEIRNYSCYAYPGGTAALDRRATIVSDFIHLSIKIKVMRVEATLLLFQGQRDEALGLMADSVFMGNLLSHNSNTLLPRLIGNGILGFSSAALEIYALNACETPEDCERLWPVLEELQQKIPSDNGMDFHAKFAAYIHGDLRDPQAGQNVADAKFQLLRMATAAWYHFLKQGNFPREAKDFAPFLPDGPPADPFASAPLRFSADPATGGLNCYSIGPDKTDDGAAIDYDPSNDTYSAGDIVTRIPHQRLYPFPRQGVHAASAKALLAQFPKGLPPDPFADTKGRGLSVSDTKPVRVYSFGPDTNQADADTAGAAYTVQEAYDPTNGTASAGDMFIEIKP